MDSTIVKRIHKGYRRFIGNVYDRIDNEMCNADGEYRRGLQRALTIVMNEKTNLNDLLKILIESGAEM